MSKVIITGGADPLLIDSVDAGGDFTSILFSSNWRSIRWWMHFSVAISGNTYTPLTYGLTNAYATIALGKTFSGYPLATYLANGARLPAIFAGNVAPYTVSGIQTGAFTITRTTEVVCANLSENPITLNVVVFDQPVS